MVYGCFIFGNAKFRRSSKDSKESFADRVATRCEAMDRVHSDCTGLHNGVYFLVIADSYYKVAGASNDGYHQR